MFTLMTLHMQRQWNGPPSFLSYHVIACVTAPSYNSCSYLALATATGSITNSIFKANVVSSFCEKIMLLDTFHSGQSLFGLLCCFHSSELSLLFVLSSHNLFLEGFLNLWMHIKNAENAAKWLKDRKRPIELKCWLVGVWQGRIWQGRIWQGRAWKGTVWQKSRIGMVHLQILWIVRIGTSFMTFF